MIILNVTKRFPPIAHFDMFNVRLKLIKENLSAIGFARLARTYGFDSVFTKKITAFSFLFGFMKMYSYRAHSLTSWASCISQISGQPVSKQAVDTRLSAGTARWLRAVLEALLTKKYESIRHWSWDGRVLIQDSTCWSMPKHLAAYFPGAYSKNGQVATARLQVCYDVNKGQFHELALQSFRDNDQKHAQSIRKWVRAGDLVLRDLGYFSQHALAYLVKIKAFFVSRLHHRVTVQNKEGPIELSGLIAGRDRVDTQIIMGKESMLPVRLVGVLLPEPLAAERRRKAKTKDGRFTPSASYLQWLGWSFFVTNLDQDQASVDQVIAFYRLRWHIEMMFKGFKSGLGWNWMFSQSPFNYNRTLATIYAMLIYVVLCWQCYRYLLNACPSLSLLRFITWYRMYFEALLQTEDLETFIPIVAKGCHYEKRNDRTNFYALASLCFNST